MSKKLQWGLIGTGSIARKFAAGLQQSDTGELVAIGSRSAESGGAFARNFPATVHASYDALLADPQVEAVYIATPHPSHAEIAIKAARAGKQILCEKPATINAAEFETVLDAVREHNVFFMEAFMYRCHPQTARVVEMIRSNAIGTIQIIRATFGYRAPHDLTSRTHSHQLAGGGILDVGCYPASMARLIAGAATGADYADPVALRAVGVIGAESRVDELTSATALFPGGIIAELQTAVAAQMENNVRIIGTEGIMLIPEPWQPGRNDAEFSKIIIFKEGIPSEYIIDTRKPLYAIEADHVGGLVRSGAKESPAMSWADTLSNMRLLDQWRREIGLSYDWEPKP